MKETLPSARYAITRTIGNTPLVKLSKVVPPGCAEIYVKLEYFNPTGSYKDRMALSIIEGAEKKGTLKKGMTVVECTAGGTGSSLALVCSAKGYSFKVISSDAFAKEKLKAMQMFGAELQLVASDGGKITPDLIPKMIGLAEKLSVENGNFWTQQFHNTDALEGYKKMGTEILEQLGRPADIFTAAVGTAGMLVGVAMALRESKPDTKIIVLEPESAPLLSKGIKGSHKIDGIAVGFAPPLLGKIKYDEVQTVNEEAARKMAKRLATEEGILAGTSTGLNVVAAIEEGINLGPDGVIVTVACDSGMKYFNSGLFD
jgi:cysteine synthase A